MKTIITMIGLLSISFTVQAAQIKTVTEGVKRTPAAGVQVKCASQGGDFNPDTSTIANSFVYSIELNRCYFGEYKNLQYFRVTAKAKIKLASGALDDETIEINTQQFSPSPNKEAMIAQLEKAFSTGTYPNLLQPTTQKVLPVFVSAIEEQQQNGNSARFTELITETIKTWCHVIIDTAF